MQASRRSMLFAIGGTLFGVTPLAVRVLAQPAERAIKVAAKKFDYMPSEISLRRGEPVLLEFTTEDVVMGFNAPDFGARTDIIPGMTTRLRLLPGKIGTFPFHCDVFCGAGHEDMTGTIIVTE